MITWMLWNGGSSYAPSDNFEREHCERFNSLAAVKHEFLSRLHAPYYPCVEHTTPDHGGPWAWICFEDPYEIGDLYPDRIMEFGARGGLICFKV